MIPVPFASTSFFLSQLMLDDFIAAVQHFEKTVDFFQRAFLQNIVNHDQHLRPVIRAMNFTCPLAFVRQINTIRALVGFLRFAAHQTFCFQLRDQHRRAGAAPRRQGLGRCGGGRRLSADHRPDLCARALPAGKSRLRHA